MEFPDVLSLDSYWSRFPPVHIAVSGIVGPKRSTGNISKPELTPTEQRMVAQGSVVPFKKLPDGVKNFLRSNAK
jgi:hypothetical protein